MKVWRVHELGEPRTALHLEEVPDPTAGPGQVLVRVLAAPANFPDVLLCRGEYQIKPPLPSPRRTAVRSPSTPPRSASNCTAGSV